MGGRAALAPMVDKRAGGTMRLIEEVDLSVRQSSGPIGAYGWTCGGDWEQGVAIIQAGCDQGVYQDSSGVGRKGWMETVDVVYIVIG